MSIPDIFQIKNCNYLFIEDYWTKISYLDDRFQHSNPRSLSEFRQKLHKNFEKKERLDLNLFRWQFEIFLNLKTEINCSSKPTGQDTRSLLTLFNNPIHDVCQNIDKSCIKILVSLSFSVSISDISQIENCNYLFIKDYQTTISHPTLMTVFNILIHEACRKFHKNCILIHLPQRTSKILLVRLTADKNAFLFETRVTCFARYTVWFGVTRSDQSTVNDYFTQSRSMITLRNFLLPCASQSAMNTVHYLTRIRFALV